MDALAGAVTNGRYLRGDGTDVIMDTLRAGDMTGTLAVANGGTGQTTLSSNHVLLGNGTSGVQAVAPGSNGNVLTSNGTTWTSTALPAGGVTSLNGETGAITNTAYGAIGSYVVAWDNTVNALGSTTYVDVNTTVAGSSLLKLANNASAEIATIGTIVTTTGLTSAGLSGTWRRMNSFKCGDFSSSSSRTTFLLVRIS
jgi:hypothetical protein